MLLIDVGNTKTAFGWVHQGDIVASWKISTHKWRLRDEYWVMLNQFLASNSIRLRSDTRVALSSVVPAVTKELKKLTQRVHVVSCQSPISFDIALPKPDQLGPDRIADAQAVVQMYSTPAIVIDLGTASTISVIDKNKAFVGGVIAPGIGISSKILFQTAAGLRETALELSPNIVGRNSEEAVCSGILRGHALMITGVVTQVKEEMQMNKAQVVATGGALDFIDTVLPPDYVRDPQLALKGLMLIARKVNTFKDRAHG